MSRNISVGIDMGTFQTRVVAAESAREGEREFPKVVGVGFSESRGLHHGCILSQPDAVKSIRQAVAQASKSAGFPITRAVVSIGGVGLSSTTTSGTVVITRADS